MSLLYESVTNAYAYAYIKHSSDFAAETLSGGKYSGIG